MSAARQANEVKGQDGDVYQYLTGPRSPRIEAIVEKFSDMQADLDKSGRP